MGKTKDQLSKRNKRQKSDWIVTPIAASPSPAPENCVAESGETSSEPAAAAVDQAAALPGQKIRPASTVAQSTASTASPSSAAKKASSKKRRKSDTSSDEEVDDEVKKIKDPKLMTARQRKMDKVELVSLPSGYRKKEKPQTKEDIQKAALESQKREQQADDRRKKDNKKTMEPLLKKQETGKQRSAAAPYKLDESYTRNPDRTYVNTMLGVYVLVQPGQEIPLRPKSPIARPTVQGLCGMPGCGKPTKYNCHKTNVPLCGLVCYMKNEALNSKKD